MYPPHNAILPAILNYIQQLAYFKSCR